MDFVEETVLDNGKIPKAAFIAAAEEEGDTSTEALARFNAVDTDKDPNAVSVTELRAYLATQNLTSAQLASVQEALKPAVVIGLKGLKNALATIKAGPQWAVKVAHPWAG